MLGRKTLSEHRSVISIKLERFALKDTTLVGGIRLNNKGFKAKSLMPIIFAKKVLEKYLVHNRG